jgi:hypothetical protein
MNIPRFSLRLLLLAVAVLCAWLARERSAVMQRRAALANLRANAELRVRTVEELRPILERTHVPPARIPAVWPWLRVRLGDEPIQSIAYYDADEATIERVRRLFPEAVVAPVRYRRNADGTPGRPRPSHLSALPGSP